MTALQQGRDLARLAGIVGGGDQPRAGFESQSHGRTLRHLPALSCVAKI
jgi:hypothetical protein